MLRAQELRMSPRCSKGHSSAGALHDLHALESSGSCDGFPGQAPAHSHSAACLPGRRSGDSVLPLPLALSSSVVSAASDTPTTTSISGAAVGCSPYAASSLWDDMANSDSGEDGPPEGDHPPQALDTLLNCLLTLQQQLQELDSENSALRSALSDQRGLMAHVQQALLEQQPDAAMQPHDKLAARVDAACECHLDSFRAASSQQQLTALPERHHSTADAHAHVHSLRQPSGATLTLRAARAAATSLAGHRPAPSPYSHTPPGAPPGTPIGGLDAAPYFPTIGSQATDAPTPSGNSWVMRARKPSLSAPGTAPDTMHQLHGASSDASSSRTNAGLGSQGSAHMHAAPGPSASGRMGSSSSRRARTADSQQELLVDDEGGFSWYLPEHKLAEMFRMVLTKV